ncbi:hypothetical protein COCOBI_pt-0580 (chloroplast) [Coccomyxa sp. Obi]|nr:hypothetical protein COCOBI_pt-0580 [Coccomyxa sp. Obi]
MLKNALEKTKFLKWAGKLQANHDIQGIAWRAKPLKPCTNT